MYKLLLILLLPLAANAQNIFGDRFIQTTDSDMLFLGYWSASISPDTLTFHLGQLQVSDWSEGRPQTQRIDLGTLSFTVEKTTKARQAKVLHLQGGAKAKLLYKEKSLHAIWLEIRGHRLFFYEFFEQSL
jgi:hypothetical protein